MDVKIDAGRLWLTVSRLWSLGYRSTDKVPSRPPEEEEMREPLELVYTARSPESHNVPPTEPPMTVEVPINCLEDIKNKQVVIMDIPDIDVQLQNLMGLLESLTGWRMHFMCIGHCSRSNIVLKTFKMGRKGEGLMMLWKRGNEWRLTFLPEAEREKTALLGKGKSSEDSKSSGD